MTLFFVCFSLFFSLFVLLNHKTPKSNVCVMLLRYKRSLASEIFGAFLQTPQNGLHKIKFLDGLNWRGYFFIGKGLRDKIFCHSLEVPLLKAHPK